MPPSNIYRYPTSLPLFLATSADLEKKSKMRDPMLDAEALIGGATTSALRTHLPPWKLVRERQQ
jgi:hypothetical protein